MCVLIMSHVCSDYVPCVFWLCQYVCSDYNKTCVLIMFCVCSDYVTRVFWLCSQRVWYQTYFDTHNSSPCRLRLQHVKCVFWLCHTKACSDYITWRRLSVDPTIPTKLERAPIYAPLEGSISMRTKMDRSGPLGRVVGAVATLCHAHIPTKRPETTRLGPTASQTCVNGFHLKLYRYGWIYR